MRARDLTAHYTDAGVAPRTELAARYGDMFYWSLHAQHGEAWFQSLLFLLAAVAAFALLVGFRSRAACAISWALLASLHLRNPLVLNGGDLLLRMLLLWSVFLPLGETWSVDWLRRGRPVGGRSVCSVASAVILLQICLVYWMTGYFKWQGVWLNPGGFEEVLRFDTYARSLSYALIQYPTVTTYLGYGVLCLEILGPLLVLSPFATSRIRMLLVPVFWLLHLGIEMSLTVGLFGVVSMAAWLLFLPGSFWDSLERICWSRRNSVSPAFSVRDESLDVTSPPKRSTCHRFAMSARDLVVVALFAYVVVWNVASIHGNWLRTLRAHSPQPLTHLLVIHQRWNMFANPLKYDGWFVVVARLSDGRVVDLLRNGQAADWDSYTKPERIYRRYPNHRWRKLYRHLATGRASYLAPSLCRYLASDWNRSHPEAAADTVELHYMQQLGNDPDERDGFMQRILHEERIRTQDGTSPQTASPVPVRE